MLYVVAVPIPGDGLVEPMNRMRLWLDGRGLQPDSFRLDLSEASAAVCRISFNSEAAAVDFAQAFSGTLLSPSSLAEA